MRKPGRTRYFLDSEFREDGRIIELISIALVCETGRSLYLVSSEFDESACNAFVREHVLPKLPPPTERVSRARIREEIAKFIDETRLGMRPEFWAYFADYDWVVFCQLFGSMIALPKGYPQYCKDLVQVMDDHGYGKQDLPAQIGELHDALADARWVQSGLEFIEEDLERKAGQ